MNIDGKQIAKEMFFETKKMVEKLSNAPRLAVFTSSPNFETQKFLTVKKKKADMLGISVNIVELPAESTTEECMTAITKAASYSDGIVVQLPFLSHIDREALVKAIPKSHDVDAFNISDNEVLPPVVGAIEEIASRNDISISGKTCVVVGAGRLVGAPVARWLRTQGGEVTVLDEKDGDISSHTKNAEVIVLGVGSPNLLTPDMVKEGVVIFDAGTSEDAGELKGDADPACAEKANIFTPVPGGIGPITVAVLLRNLVFLAARSR